MPAENRSSPKGRWQRAKEAVADLPRWARDTGIVGAALIVLLLAGTIAATAATATQRSVSDDLAVVMRNEERAATEAQARVDEVTAEVEALRDQNAALEAAQAEADARAKEVAAQADAVKKREEAVAAAEKAAAGSTLTNGNHTIGIAGVYASAGPDGSKHRRLHLFFEGKLAATAKTGYDEDSRRDHAQEGRHIHVIRVQKMGEN